MKLGHLTRTSLERLAEGTDMLRSLVDEVWRPLPEPGTSAQNQSLADQWSEGQEHVFPTLSVSPAVGEWRGESGRLLSLKTPANIQLLWREAALRQLCEGSELPLTGVRESRWTEGFGSDSSPSGMERELQTDAELTWTRALGGGGCPFSSLPETLEHLVVSCPWLADLYKLLQEWVDKRWSSLTLSLQMQNWLFGKVAKIKWFEKVGLIRLLLVWWQLASEFNMCPSDWLMMVSSVGQVLCHWGTTTHWFKLLAD